MKKLAIMLLLVAASVSSAMGDTIVGQPIHNFSLPDLNGTFRSPNQYRGKILGIFLLGYD